MTSRSLTFGRGPGADDERSEIETAIVRAFGIPAPIIGEPAPERWRPCVFCGITWQFMQRHQGNCPIGNGRLDPMDVRMMHVLPAPMPFLRARIGRTTLPWEAQ